MANLPIAAASPESRQLAEYFGHPVANLINADNAAEIRQQAHAEYAPRAERAIETHRIEWKQIELGGIPCIEAKPVDSTPNRTLLYCYGGGYVYGSAYDDLCITAPLSRHGNLRVVAPVYRLAPESPWPAAINDGFAVYRALAEEVSENFVLAGESAGGNLALVLSLRARQVGLRMPQRIALLSPWCDLTPLVDQPGTLSDDPTLHPDDLDHAAVVYAGSSRYIPEVSPILGDYNESFPQMLITTGTRDILMHQCVRLSRVLINAGITVDLRIWQDLWHVFECYDELPEARQSLDEIADFLAG